jgi:hypothetical protein
MGDMIFIIKEELERMLSGGKRNLCFGLSRTKMQAIKIIGNGFIRSSSGGSGASDEMVVAGIGLSTPAGATPMLMGPKRHATIDCGHPEFCLHADKSLLCQSVR